MTIAFGTNIPVPLSLKNPLAKSNRAPPRASAANFPFQNADPMAFGSTLPSTSPSPLRTPRTTPIRSSEIRLVASDLDGTLLTSKKRIDRRNTIAILGAMQRGMRFIPATGKSRSGAIRAMGALGAYLVHSSNNRFPGIFLNGLIVYGVNGEVISEEMLTEDAQGAILKEAEERGLTVLFYSGDSLLVKERTKETDMFIVSYEPVPKAKGDLSELIGTVDIHKALLVDPRGDVVAHRKSLEAAFKGLAEITQARPDVLEIMPPGVSKGVAFTKMMAHLGVERRNSMAIGDGENDVELLSAAGLGVAMGNAVPQLLEVADVVVASNDMGGVAEAVRCFSV